MGFGYLLRERCYGGSGGHSKPTIIGIQFVRGIC